MRFHHDVLETDLDFSIANEDQSVRRAPSGGAGANGGAGAAGECHRTDYPWGGSSYAPVLNGVWPGRGGDGGNGGNGSNGRSGDSVTESADVIIDTYFLSGSVTVAANGGQGGRGEDGGHGGRGGNGGKGGAQNCWNYGGDGGHGGNGGHGGSGGDGGNGGNGGHVKILYEYANPEDHAFEAHATNAGTEGAGGKKGKGAPGGRNGGSGYTDPGPEQVAIGLTSEARVLGIDRSSEINDDRPVPRDPADTNSYTGTLDFLVDPVKAAVVKDGANGTPGALPGSVEFLRY
jgi:hypothetical protein